MYRRKKSPSQLLLPRAPDEKEEPNEHRNPTIKCISLLNPTCTKRAGEKLSDVHLQWLHAERSTASQIHRQLRSRSALDGLIDSHLLRLRSHYHHSLLPSLPIHVPLLLFPSWNPPLLTASLSWLGDALRPSLILSLIPPSLSSPLPTKSLRLLSESIRRFRIQEAVLDEEMAEYQSTSILNLPFGRRNRRKRRRRAAEILREEMGKIARLMRRAQRMRFKAVEVAVKGVLDRNQAAEFLVAFAGIQDAVHRQAGRWRAKVGNVAVPLQAFRSSDPSSAASFAGH